jgi:hypothetical protein
MAHVIDKESLKIKMLEQVLLEKVCQLFWNLRGGRRRGVMRPSIWTRIDSAEPSERAAY